MEENNNNWSSNSNSTHEEDSNNNNIGCSLSLVPPIGLSLELGRRGYDDQCEYSLDTIDKVGIGNSNKLIRPYCGGFTILQLEELQLQALIFKYITAGIPVPNHLLFPICQSFSSSFAAFPTSLGIGQMCLESTRKGIDQEPWRCRRTDGKKWRCGKEVIPHHKYCERHIHRGRQRSRKLVDSSSSSSSSSTSHFSSPISTTSTSTSSTQFGSNMTHLSISLPQNASCNSPINHFPSI